MVDAAENNINERICRLCAQVQRYPIKLFTSNSFELDQLVNKILKYAGINFVNDDCFPNGICASCHLEAESTEKFLDMVKTAQFKLEQLINHAKSIDEDVIEQPVDMSDLDMQSENVYKRRGSRKQSKIKKIGTVENLSEHLVGNQKSTFEPEAPISIILSEELLPSSLISDTSEVNSNTLNPKEPFAELRSANGEPLAAVIVVDTNSESNANPTFSNIRLVCEFCKGVFVNREFRKHLQTHNNCAYECTECLENYRSRVEFNQHQKKTGHQGMGIIENFTESDTQNEIISNAVKQRTNITGKYDGKTDAAINITVNDDGQITSINSAMTVDGEKDETIVKSAASRDSIKCFESIEQEQSMSYICLQCEKSFTSHYAVLRHYSHVHIGIRVYKCKQCPASFKHQTNYAYHIAKHTGYRRFKCELCTKAFRQNCELNLHMRTHTGDKPFKCEFCTKSFAHRSNMVTHIRLHTGLLPFKCETCGSIFNSSSHWKAHKAGHLKHELQKLQADNTNTKSKPAAPINLNAACANTNESSATTLLKPKRARVDTVEILPTIQISVNQKPSEYSASVPVSAIGVKSIDIADASTSFYKFQCNLCLQHFKQKSALTKHIRTHNNEKPYKCPHCPRTFADPSNFKRHKRLHKTASEQIQNVSTQLNQQVHREWQKQGFAYFSPTHSAASDPDPDGLEANERVALVSFTNSTTEKYDDDGSLPDVIGHVASNSVALSNICATTSVKASSKVVCISYPDPSNPNDNNVTTFFVPN